MNTTPHPTNKKVYFYNLTEKGMDLFPIIAEYIKWSDQYLNDHLAEEAKHYANFLHQDRQAALDQFRKP